MASLAELRKKRKAVVSTRQITKAMKMVAGARYYKAYKQWQDSNVFDKGIESLVLDLIARNEAAQAMEPFLPSKKSQKGTKAILAITGDRGLCGAFHQNVLRETEKLIKVDPNVILFAAGTKAAEFYKRRGVATAQSYPNLFREFIFRKAEHIALDMLQQFQNGKFTEIICVYNRFRSVIRQEVVVETLLPILNSETQPATRKGEMLFEPSAEEIAPLLISFYLRSRIYRMLRESYAAELAARMSAMDNATRNAGSLLQQLTLEMNKVRQAIITNEITEIVGTNEVLR